MCFSLAWIEALLINIVVLAVIVGVLRILVPWVIGLLGVNAGPLMAIINLIIWGIVLVWVIYFVFSLLGCLGGGAGLGSLSLSPHR
jgi:hypothetical protein